MCEQRKPFLQRGNQSINKFVSPTYIFARIIKLVLVCAIPKLRQIYCLGERTFFEIAMNHLVYEGWNILNGPRRQKGPELVGRKTLEVNMTFWLSEKAAVSR